VDGPSINYVTCQRDGKGERAHDGFSLLEMMMVVTVILILASISTPFYRTAIIRVKRVSGTLFILEEKG
jgi:prepilin-type N-terminal cleavage/methylation domain-containing protein